MGRPATIVINPGDQFGRLTAIKRLPNGRNREIRWLCKCTCGAIKNIRAYKFANGNTKSCGCLMRESRGLNSVTHGMTGTQTYHSYWAMLARCYNPKNNRYELYGARGITVCERWRLSFENFFADMGLRPRGKTLDRWPDRDGNYELANCRWATAQQQMANRRKFHHKKKRVYGR